jgi:hypothetical protein
LLLGAFSLNAQTFEFSGYKVYNVKPWSLIEVREDPGTAHFSTGLLRMSYHSGVTEYYSLYDGVPSTIAAHKAIKENIRYHFHVSGDMIIYEDLNPDKILVRNYIIVSNARFWIMTSPQPGENQIIIAEIILK